MRTQPTKSRRILIYCGMLLIVMCAVGVTATRRQQEVKLPKIISKVKSLEVVSATVQGESRSEVVAIEIRNNSDKPIIAISVESGDDKNASGTGAYGFKDGDEPPAVVIAPHETITIDMPLSDVLPGQPIKVAGVMYADGTEDGEKGALGTLRRQKEHHKAKKLRKEGASSQQ